MSQAALQLSTTSPVSGLVVVTNLNFALAALASLQSGIAAPVPFSTGPREGALWLDTSIAPHMVRFYDGTVFKPTFLANPAPDAVFLNANFGVL